ncbi:MAG: membrane protein insertase YidC [Geobacter sp.]|nr:membrane protein insertase YidC [Geobacter sp.]
MEKRTIIAVGLSIAVFLLFNFLFPTPKQKPAPVNPPAQTAQAVTTAQPTGAQSSQTAPPAAQDVTVETDLYTAVFTSQGGRLKKFVLKKYSETPSPNARPVTLFEGKTPDAYALGTQSRELALDPNALYNVSADKLLVKQGEKKELAFTLATPQGYQLRKVYTFDGSGYGVSLTHQLQGAAAAGKVSDLGLTLTFQPDPNVKVSQFDIYGPATFSEEKARFDTLKDLGKGPKAYDKGVLWTSFGDKYFLQAVIADNSSIASTRITQLPNSNVQTLIALPPLALNPGQAVSVNHRLYFGPKDLDILKAQGSRLESAIDFGWFSVIAKPLLYGMKFLYGYVQNYGVAVIIITVILKLIFFPLTHKSYKSMKQMQKLQPKMTAIREKYKSDRDAMNREIMKLYQEHKVNPLGGCLPMLVQIPVFFALYKALMFSIELRHAPFMLWITDLSAKDPYYITPIIMGVTMFVQQKMTPSNMDPMQQKIMLALPVVFTFMFLNFPSGLVLYWLVNNILTIGQQYYINKSLGT